MNIADEIDLLFARKGGSAYFGEPVSQLEHALQAAHLAREQHATPALVVAALLHDIGHLVEDVAEDIAQQGIDARHEEIGQGWLSARFEPDICEAVGLHVDAKRYLCAIDPAYFGLLSPASVLSLQLQGGPMSEVEVRAFENHTYFREAVVLRRWDDQAKVAGLEIEPLASYRDMIEAAHLRRAE